jgi:hypothetical protein
MKTIQLKLVKKVILCLFLGVTYSGFSQIGIGTADPSNQSSLDIRATDKGLLMPRLTTAQRTTLGATLTTAANSNNKGMQVFDTDLNSNWFWNGTTWVQVVDDNSTSRKVAVNFENTPLQPYQIVFIDPSTSSTFNKNYAFFLTTFLTYEATLNPIIGYVDSPTPIAAQQEFYLKTFSRSQSLYGISGSFNQNEEIWYRPFQSQLWGTTRDTQNPCFFLGFAKQNSGSAAGRLVSFDPKWFNTSNIISSTFKPVLNNTIANSASITAIGRYLVPATGLSGDFSGQANNYADYNGTSFTYTIPTSGDKVAVLGGTNVGVVYTYTEGVWVKNGQTTPLPTDNYLLSNAYNANDLVIRNNKIYQANGAVPANTAFAIGTTGATWKKISAIPEWAVSEVYETGDLVKKDGNLYEANANIPTGTAFITGTTGATWKTLIGAAEFNFVYPTNSSTTSSATVADLPGANLSLPSAGVYRVYYNMSTTGSVDGGNCSFSITNSSNSVYNGSSGTSIKVYGGSTGSMATQEITISVNAPTIIKVRWNTNGAGTTTLVNSTSASSVFGYEKIAGFLPITIGTNGTTGIPNWTDGSAITIGATTTAPTKPTTTVTDKIYYKQIGAKTWQVEMVFYNTNATGANSGSGDYLFTLPNGLSFDTTVLSQAFYTGTTGGALVLKSLVNSNAIVGHQDGTGSVTTIGGVVPYDATRFRIFAGNIGQIFAVWSSGWYGMTTPIEVRVSFTFQSAN